MKTATYQTSEGPLTIEYDETAPCICCNEPVITASMGGTRLCPWCDCGVYRDGCSWQYVFVSGRMEPVFPHAEHAKATDQEVSA